MRKTDFVLLAIGLLIGCFSIRKWLIMMDLVEATRQSPPLPLDVPLFVENLLHMLIGMALMIAWANVWWHTRTHHRMLDWLREKSSQNRQKQEGKEWRT